MKKEIDEIDEIQGLAKMKLDTKEKVEIEDHWINFSSLEEEEELLKQLVEAEKDVMEEYAKMEKDNENEINSGIPILKKPKTPALRKIVVSKAIQEPRRLPPHHQVK